MSLPSGLCVGEGRTGPQETSPSEQSANKHSCPQHWPTETAHLLGASGLCTGALIPTSGRVQESGD